MRRNLFSAAPLVLGLSIVSSIASLASAKTWMQDQDWTSLQEVVNIAASGDTIACIGEPIDEGDITFPDKSPLIQSISEEPSLIIGELTFEAGSRVLLRMLDHHGSSSVEPLASVKFTNYRNQDFFGGLGAGVYQVNDIQGEAWYVDSIVNYPIYVHSMFGVDWGSVLVSRTLMHTSRFGWPAIKADNGIASINYDSMIESENSHALEAVNEAFVDINSATLRSSEGDAIRLDGSGCNISHATLDGLHAFNVVNSYGFLDGVTFNGSATALNIENGVLTISGSEVNADINGAVLTGEVDLSLLAIRFNTTYGFWCDDATGVVGMLPQDTYGFDEVRNPDSGDCDLDIRWIP